MGGLAPFYWAVAFSAPLTWICSVCIAVDDHWFDTDFGLRGSGSTEDCHELDASYCDMCERKL